MTIRSWLVFVCASAILQAAPAGSIAGAIRDPAGAMVRAAAVTAVSNSTGARRSTTSSGGGEFLLALLPPGEWTLEVESAGFERAVVPDVRVEVGQTTRIEITLRIAGERESADVRAEAVPLTGKVVSRDSIARLPLNGRQYLDLALLAPGLVPAPAGTQGLGFNFAGSRSQSNVYLLDGVSNQDTQNNGALNGFRISEAIAEYNVLTSPPLPEFGRGSGVQINVVTRGGSNQWHGSAFEYLRNTRLSAADFFTNKLGGAKAPLNRNQFGGAFGGPIRQDRTFFFISYEDFRQVSHVVSSTRVPSAAERATVSDPVSLRLLDFWPLANASGTLNYIADVRNLDYDKTGLVRIDHSLTPGDQVAARWIEYRGESVVAGPTPGSGGNTGDPAQRSGMLRLTHTYSATWLSELVFGFSSNRQERAVQDQDVQPALLIPLPGVPAGPVGLPSISITGGYASLGSNQNFPQGRYTSTAELGGSVSWRSMRWGFQLRREGLRQYLNRSSRGVINFSSFANYARGLINSASIRNGDTLAHWRRDPYALYWQDQRRLGRGLTIDFGVRYESGSPSTERDGRAVNFVPGVGPVLAGTNRLLSVDPSIRGTAALQFVSSPVTLPSSGVRADRNNFGPMVGIAWSPGKTWVLRAGYRLSYDESFGNLLTGMALAPPFSLQTSQTANVTQPGQFGWGLAFDQNVPLISNFGKQGPGTPTVGTITWQGLDPDLRTPYVSHYSFAIQKPLCRLLLEAAYQGSAGRKLGSYVDLNQPKVIVRDPTRRGPLAPNEQIFPYPQWGQAQVVKSLGNSNYNGAVITLRSRAHAAGFFELTWTHGKSVDYNSSYFGSGSLPGETGAPADSTNLRLEHGPSAFDIRDRIVATYGAAYRGWRLDGIATAQSGSPFTVVSGNPDSSGFNQSTAGVSPNGGNRPDIIHSGELPHDYGNPDAAFDTSRFVPALAGRVGSSGRNQYYGPGLVNFDVAISKRVPFGEKLSGQVRADFFNVLNHTNFANPVADLSNANFGRITQTLGSAVSNATGTSGGAAGAPRVVQLSLRLQF